MVLVNSTGKVAAFYLAKGDTDNDLSNEAMSEVNLSSEGYPRYTVYEITDATKRYLKDNVAPVFEQDQGTSTWITLTPSVIQYAGSRIFLSSALTSGTAVRAASGHYFDYAQCLGASDWKLDMSWETEKAMHLGDSVPAACLMHKNWTATVGAYWALTQATLSTSMVGDNNDIVLTHEPGGTSGNSITLELNDPAAPSQSLVVTVTGTDIVVDLATDGTSTITTTAAQLVAALNGSDAVLALGVTAAYKAANDGTGVVTDMAHTHLSGGLDAVDLTSEDNKIIAIFYDTYSSDRRYEGFCVIKGNSISIDPGKLIKQSLTLESCGSPLYYRES